MFDVEVAGEGHMTVELLKAVAMSESADFRHGLGRPAETQQVEDSETLLGSRRSIDPRHETLVALWRMADAESPVVPLLLKPAAMPDQLEVVGEVERVEVLMGRRKDRNRPPLALRKDGPMPGGDGNGLRLRSRRHALQLVVRIDPRDRFAVRCRAGQSGIVKDSAGVLFCADNGLGMNESAARVNGEAEVSLERARRQSVEDDGSAPALTLDADLFPFPDCPERLMGAAGRVVEERVPPLLAQVPGADGHKCRRVDLPEERGVGAVGGRGNAQFFDQG